jgi:hypothetical protein
MVLVEIQREADRLGGGEGQTLDALLQHAEEDVALVRLGVPQEVARDRREELLSLAAWALLALLRHDAAPTAPLDAVRLRVRAAAPEPPLTDAELREAQRFADLEGPEGFPPMTGVLGVRLRVRAAAPEPPLTESELREPAPSPEDMARGVGFYRTADPPSIDLAFAAGIRAERARVASDPDTVWLAAVRAEADRIEAAHGPGLDFAGAADAMATEAEEAADSDLTDAARKRSALTGAAWALILDRRARAVKP